MKLITAPIILLIAILIFTCSPGQTAGGYQWIRAIDTGVKTWPRWVLPVAGRDKKLWMIDENATWISSDGIKWTTTPNNAACAVRPGASQVFFKDKFWLMGGMNSWAEFTNEIWSSSDGIHWTIVAEHAPWLPRRDALVVEFENKLWLFGGAESSGQKDLLPKRRFQDVWQSDDGSTWKRISVSMPPNSGQILVFQNQIWLLGAYGVWTTTDANTWRQTATERPFSDRGGFGSAVYDGKMWVFGGVGQEKATNEVWNSQDGITWQQTDRAPWFPRGGEYTTVFDGKLWIYGGKTGTTYEQADDVWFMARSNP